MKPTDFLLLTCMPVIKNTAGLNYFQRSTAPYVLATSLRRLGYRVQVVDCAASWTDEQWDEIFDRFVGDSTKAIGFSTTFYDRAFDRSPSDDETKSGQAKPLGLPVRAALLKKLKKRSIGLNPKIEWIVGGANSLMVQMQVPGIFDRVFVGFSDQQLLDYVKMLKGDLPEYSDMRIWNYDSKGERFDFTKSQLIYHPDDAVIPNETMCLEIARGCIFKCSFCSFSLNGKKKNDFIKDPIFLRDELIRNYEMFGITTYTTSDDTHNDSIEKLEQLHRVTRDLPFEFAYTAYLRLDLLARQPAVPQLLMEMGFVGTYFGVETFNRQAAQSLGKGAVPPEALKEFLIRLKQEIWKDRVKVALGFIVGLPYETRESLESTLVWLEQNPNVHDSVVFWPLLATSGEVPYPGYDSKLATNPDKYGLYFLKNDDPWEWRSNLKGGVSSYSEACDLTKEFHERLHPLQGLSGFEAVALRAYEEEIRGAFGISWKELILLPKAEFQKLMATGRLNLNQVYQKKVDEYYRLLMAEGARNFQPKFKTASISEQRV